MIPILTMYQIIFMKWKHCQTNDPYEYVLFLDVIVQWVYAEKR